MLLLVDKPSGISSYDVIRRVKHLYPGQKIGHSGTLDPLATWLLILGVGKWTKQLTAIQWLDKSYRAEMTFACDTDTWDIDFWKKKDDYPVVEKDWVVGIEKNSDFFWAPYLNTIEAKLQSLTQSAFLPLPPFSAKKKWWKKLYELARKGKEVLIDKEMMVNEIQVLDYAFPNLGFDVSVGSGTYIRSIAYWLWKQFSLGWVISSLRRTSIWDYRVEDAIPLSELLK